MRRFIPFFGAAVFGCMACYGAGVGFPPAKTCISPDLKWTIRCVSEDQRDGTTRRTLLLSRLGSSEGVAIWFTERSCDVLWQDDGPQIAITDWTGSSIAEIFLVEAPGTTKARRLEIQNVKTFVHTDELDGHIYHEALKWESDHELLIRIFGHTDENPSHGFAYYLSVNVESQIAKLVRKADAEEG